MPPRRIAPFLTRIVCSGDSGRISIQLLYASVYASRVALPILQFSPRSNLKYGDMKTADFFFTGFESSSMVNIGKSRPAFTITCNQREAKILQIDFLWVTKH
ncbi:unnamed protein product [Rangifer tarandus platyrhynchus]|uniref:Uncharacterized protein n=1 Tax=Rangifer tarandus platyrhynchus TaxID=3082113 RepID=A0AC59ZGG2_RANTA